MNQPKLQIPEIADKVKFWEEQDRINHALIPRVLRINEMLSEIAARQVQIPEMMAAVEARINARLAHVEPQRKLSMAPILVSVAALIVAISTCVVVLFRAKFGF